MKKKILIVEDDALNRRFLTDVLASEGYETVTSDRAEGVLELVSAEKPDGIVMDICMPDGDGIELTRCLKQDERFTGIPVIAVTAMHEPTDEAIARAEGCADYLRKPVGISGFIRSVSKYVN